MIWGTCCAESTNGDAYREELVGIYILLNAIVSIEKSSSKPINGKIKIGRDNEKLGYKNMEEDVKVSSTHKHMDVIKAIRRLKKLLRTSIDIYHI